jgi:uncharacterized membrane protein
MEKSERAAKPYAPWIAGLAVGLVLADAVFFSTVAVLRHQSLHSTGFDLGNFDQAMWNTLHGRPFRTTNIPGITTRLALHVEPILLLIAPLYLVWSDPRALLILQATALAAGGWPVFRLAASRLQSGLAGVAFLLVYLLFPALQGPNLYDFHPSPLAAPLLAFACYAADRRQWKTFAGLALLAALCREEIPLLVAAMGLYLALVGGARRLGLATAALALGYFWTANALIIPHFSATDTHQFLGGNRYAQFGDSVVEVALTVATRPALAWRHVSSDPLRLRYLTHLLFPVAFLALLDPATLLVAAPLVAVNVLSNYEPMYWLDRLHYSAAAVPFVVVAAANGTARLAGWLQARRGIRPAFTRRVLLAGMLTATAGYALRFGHTPLSAGFQTYRVTARTAQAYSLIERIPSGAVVSANGNLNPHVTRRPTAYVFPKLEGGPGEPPAEYVLIDARGVFYPLPSAEAYAQAIADLDAAPAYELVGQAGDFYLWQRKEGAG